MLQLDTDKKYSNDELQDLDMVNFFKEGGDPDFNPARNRAVIQETIRRQQEYFRQKRKLYDEGLRERMNAAASYILYLEKGGATGAEKYFGKRELARLRGIDVAQKIQNITRFNVPGYRNSRKVVK